MSQVPPEEPTSDAEDRDAISREQALVAELVTKPLGARLRGYARLTGPGWLQSAITLGGGSLASSLFLGIFLGFAALWVQPLAMILGVIMLSAIGYVALTTGRRPFQAINEHVNPVLGWGWALATAMANIVWCLPQFSLGVASAQQNLFPSLIGTAVMPESTGKTIAAAVILAAAIVVIWFYDKGSRGIKIFETVLKVIVGIIILCFFGVVVTMSVKGALDWGAIFRGLVPNPGVLFEPADTMKPLIAATDAFADFWKAQTLALQRDVMISATATAVGINMTFLLPYSFLAKGWNRNYRGLAIFDLSTGLFIPFILATGCVVIASASQFHTEYHPGLLGEDYQAKGLDAPGAGLIGKFDANLDRRIKQEIGGEAFGELAKAHQAVASRRAQLDQLIAQEIGEEAFKEFKKDKDALKARRAALAPGEALLSELETRRKAVPRADQVMAAALIKRSAFDLAASLKPLTGGFFSHYVFGIGVIGMALSSIIILMLISGFVVCEMLGIPPKGNAHRLACLLPAIGVIGPFIWTGKAAFWLAVPTSVFGMVLAPIAYWTFFLLMNSRSLLGDDMPRGGRRVGWNVLMLIAALIISGCSLWSIWNNAKWAGLAGLAAFLTLLIVVQVKRKPKPLSALRQGGPESAP